MQSSLFLESFRMEHWTTGLVKQGVYYEGWVSDLDSVLASHSRETVTSYGTRRSTKNTANQLLFEEDKENCKSEVCSIQVLILKSQCLYCFLFRQHVPQNCTGTKAL